MTVDPTGALSWLADHALRVSVLIAVVGAVSLLVRRASSHGRLFVWTMVLYTAMAMPVMAFGVPDIGVPALFSEPVILLADAGATSSEVALSAGPTLNSTAPVSLKTWLLALYLAGAAVLIARLWAGVRITSRLLRTAHPIADPALELLVHSTAANLQLARIPSVVQHPFVHVPFVSGVFRPVLVLPETWREWNTSTRQAVLAHELSHLARHDLRTLRVAAAYRAVMWFNPLSWWLRRRLEALTERASDDAVLAAGVEPTAYAETLVKFFAAAQHSSGRANWQLAMARRGSREARKRVGRVLRTSEGGIVRFGIKGRAFVAAGVVMAAVPVIALSAANVETVRLSPVLEAAPSHASVPTVVVPATRQVKRTPVNIELVQAQLARMAELMNTAELVEDQQQEEPEPWRSTMKATDADTAPRMTVSIHPRYTAAAMFNKLQGTVELEVIVSAEGEVTAARVSKSLDQQYGLDEEALAAARQWKFLPGTFQGQPVALRVKLQMEFRLH